MARAISGRSDQERLLRALPEELDGPADVDADRAWLEEAQRRSAKFDAGLVETIPAEEVFERVRGSSDENKLLSVRRVWV